MASGSRDRTARIASQARGAALALAVLLLVPGMAAGAVADPGGPPVGGDPAQPEVLEVPAGEPAGLVVHLAPGADMAAVAASARARGLAVRGAVPEVRALLLEPGEASGADEVRALGHHPGVLAVEPDHPVASLEVVPDDPLFEHQWGLRRSRLPRAWEHTTGHRDTVVAILDTKIDRGHEDLAGAFVAGVDIVEGPRGDASHGTLSAGVAAARTSNAMGIAGACWRCRIMPVTVLDSSGSGRHSDVAQGLVWAADNGADVANLSLGGTAASRLLEEAVRYAHRSGVLVVAAAGNAGSTERVYPAAYDEALAVAATDQHDTLYWWSTRGGWVDLAAPGVNPSTSPGDDYAWYSGTSSAAPLVSGIAGLALSTVPGASNVDVSAALRATAVDVAGIGGGRVDAAATLAHVRAAEPAPPPEPPPAPPKGNGPDPEVDTDPEPVVLTERLAGEERFATAAELSRQRFEPGVAVAYVATGLEFPDALAAGAVAGAAGGPVLLTAGTLLPGSTKDELRRLEPREVVVAGGQSAISRTVVEEIGRAAGAPVRRVAGLDRYATAADLAVDRFDGPVPVAFVATGIDFPDALAAVPAAVRQGGPVLLAARDTLPQATVDALRALRPEQVVVLGGTQAIGEGVAQRIEQAVPGDAAVMRLSGPDRFQTAARVVAGAFDAGTHSVHLATGTRFADALAAGPAAAARGGPLLLVTRDALPPPSEAELERLGPRVVSAVGGSVVMSDRVIQSAGEAAARARP